VNLGDGRFGYLPYLVTGSLLRLPFTEKKPANHPLTFPDEVQFALWPSSMEIEKRRDTRPATLRLPGGEEVSLSLGHLGLGTRGSPMPEALRRYLIDNRAEAGEALLIRIVDGEAGLGEAWFESRLQRDKAAVEARNRVLAEAAYQFFQRYKTERLFIWELVIPLLARGLYQADVAPDPLQTVLSTDPRYVPAAFHSWMLAEMVTPDVRAKITESQRLEEELFYPWAEPEPAPEQLTSPRDVRRSMERALADVGAALAEQDFASIDEANAFLQEMLAGGGLPPHRAETPLERAQDLMYDAWDAPSARERIRMARQALAISPDCADAYVLLAEETARNPKEAADLYARGVAAGERALGDELFEQEAGHFWSMFETRPYMRARFGLAHALWASGQRQEAIGHLQAMLRLNPGDNQGVRYILLNWYLEIGEAAELEKLLDLYPDDAAAMWAYGRALHGFRGEGDTRRTRKLRAEALATNSHVPPYLLGRKRLPHTLPDMIGFGDESEAVVCAAEQMAAWRQTPGALTWLDARPQ
jgi:tetratricopeptide (TPR) repeat protein